MLIRVNESRLTKINAHQGKGKKYPAKIEICIDLIQVSNETFPD